MPRKYLDNPYIKHYLEEMDEIVDEYIAARNREDWKAIGSTLNKMTNRAGAIKKRTEKIVDGRGREENAGSTAWNPPDAQKPPPKAVRAEES